MSNLKFGKYSLLFLMLLSALLSGCGKKEEKRISSEYITEESGFGEDTAREGDFVEEKNFEAEQLYPISNVITSDYDGVVLKEINVKAGQAVKKGDLLVTIESITEETLAKREAAIARNKEDVDKTLAGYTASIENFRQNMEAASGNNRELYRLQLEKTQKQYDNYLKNGNEDQEEMKAELERLRALKGDMNIYAPYDGVVDTVKVVEPGTELTTDREILTIHSEEQIFLKVTKGNGLRYGQEVTVETGSGEKIKTYKGIVISADNVRGDGQKDGSAVVQPQEDIPVKELSNVRIKANTKELHHVLVVKNYGIAAEKDKSYVSILDGNKIMKRSVTTGGSCGGYTWILQGLEDGQSVMIQ